MDGAVLEIYQLWELVWDKYASIHLTMCLTIIVSLQDVLTAFDTQGTAHTGQQMLAWTLTAIQQSASELGCPIAGVVGDNASNMVQSRELLSASIYIFFVAPSLLFFPSQQKMRPLPMDARRT